MKTIYKNGHIYTLNDKKEQSWMLIDHDQVIKTGTNAELNEETEYACDQMIDLNGMTVLPAFIDAHSHFSQLAGALMQVIWSPGDDVQMLHHKVETFISKHQLQAEDWILVRGYNEGKDGRLSLEELDSVCKEHPMVIQYASGHMGLFNSKALYYFGITPDVTQIEGGKIEIKDGRLTGYLEENAYFVYLKKMPMPSVQQYLNSFKQAEQIYASYGITTIQEGMFVKEMFPLYEALYHADILKSDVVIYPDLEAYQLMKQMEQWQFLLDGKYHHHIRLGGLKIFLDGSPQGKTAWLLEPYEGDTSCGYGTMTDEAVREAVVFAVKEGRQLLAHCNGDAACEQYIRIVEEVSKTYPEIKDLHFVIVHAQLLSARQMDRAYKLGMIPSFFVAHIYHYGDIHRKNLGEKRASRISHIKHAVEIGMPYTMHQDTPVMMPDMLETIWCAVKRQTKEGVILEKDFCIDVKDAILGVTRNAAIQYQEMNKGTLEKGMQADFMILSKDPFDVSTDEIKEIKVLETFKSGKTLYQA